MVNPKGQKGHCQRARAREYAEILTRLDEMLVTRLEGDPDEHCRQQSVKLRDLVEKVLRSAWEESAMRNKP
jgi:hypothetical protein